MDYKFPFDTCETPNKVGIAQPYSAIFNLINCFIILFFLTRTKNTNAFILLFSILIFEIFHVFSHCIHIKGQIQTNVIHFIAYLINFSFFNLFYNYTNTLPNYNFLIYLVLLIVFDIYSIFNLSIVYYFVSQSIIFISLLLYYYPLLPKFIQNSINTIIILVFIIIGLIFNEKYNCNKMLSIYPEFPFHIFIEIMGIVLFYVICSNFYKI